jgi:hypothetical protein
MKPASVIPVLFSLIIVLLPAPSGGQTAMPIPPAGTADSTSLQRARYGIQAATDFIRHIADFQQLPEAPSCCPHFTSTDIMGYSIGVIYERPITERWLVAGRLSFDYVPAAFRDREQTTFIIDGKATDGSFEHRIDAHYGMITLLPTVGYKIFSNVIQHSALFVHGGVEIGVKTSSAYTQKEQIVEPEGYGVYVENGRDVRNEFSGSLPSATPVMAAISLGLNADAPLNTAETIILSPEIRYSFGITPAVQSLSWYVHKIRMGVAVKYMP